MQAYRKEVFEAAIEALNAHIVSLGGEVKSDNVFDPFKAVVSSTNYNKMPV